MCFLGLWTLVEFSVFLRRDRIGSAFGAHCLGRKAPNRRCLHGAPEAHGGGKEVKP
jgi:hypothetical protein